MIEFRTGDIFAYGTIAIVNPVNCVGVMGRGLALEFKRLYPENFEAYAQACADGLVKPGKMFIFVTEMMISNPRLIINFPTKRHWRDKSHIEDIESGLRALASDIMERRIRAITIPPLGCGLGGLPWADVRPLVERELAGLRDVRVIVLEPPSFAGDSSLSA